MTSSIKRNVLRAILMIFFFPSSVGFSMSIVDDGSSVVVTNMDAISYCAIEFSTQTNKIPIAAAAKMRDVFEKIVDAESVGLTYEYMLVRDTITIETFLQKHVDSRSLRMMPFLIKDVLGQSTYASLNVIDNWLWIKTGEARLITMCYFETEYENIRAKMSPEELCAFIVISAHMKAKVNDAFVKTIIESSILEKGRNPENGFRRMDEAMRDIIKRAESRGAANTNAVGQPSTSKGKDD